MSTLFKDLFNESFYRGLAKTLKGILPNFDEQVFVEKVLADGFESLEMKQRITRTSEVLHEFMPVEFSEGSRYLLEMVRTFEVSEEAKDGLQYLFIPEYVERYGIDDYPLSVNAFEVITPFITCEFAVRPFIVKYPQMIDQMLEWTKHPNRRVRRLASEGARPRLPWGMALTKLKKDPTSIMPIIDALKDDECEVVRRSVANNLNDIAKDNPEIVIDFSNRYFGDNTDLDKLIKHACRTLLKQAEPNTLALFGFDSQDIEMSGFSVHTPIVTIGDALAFSFTVHNCSDQDNKLRLEYGVYYQKHNGTLARKVFKISERDIAAGEVYPVDRKQNFKVITTRKFHVGLHQVSIILNGRELEKLDFTLVS